MPGWSAPGGHQGAEALYILDSKNKRRARTDRLPAPFYSYDHAE